MPLLYSHSHSKTFHQPTNGRRKQNLNVMPSRSFHHATHKPGEPTVPTPAQTKSGRGSKSPAELSTQEMPLALGEVKSRSSFFRGYLFGAPAPMSPVTRISPGAEKISLNSSSRDSSQALSFHENKAPKTAFLPVSPHGYCAPKHCLLFAHRHCRKIAVHRTHMQLQGSSGREGIRTVKDS